MTKEKIEGAVQVFGFGGEGQEIQIRALADTEGNPWFVAKDVAVALGYTDTVNAIKLHCKYKRRVRGGKTPPLESNETKLVAHIGGGKTLTPAESQTELVTDNTLDPQLVVIPEFDVYRLMMRSKLESAEKFQDWVFEEVLPAIRKYGYYISVSSQPHMLPENYDYFPVEALAAAAEISIVDFNKKLQRYELQEAAVNANGMMVFKLTKKGKKFGIPQQAYEEGGIKMPPRILWKSSIFNVMAFGFKTGSRDRLYANNNQCSLT
jgi:prophage antirepressor-like protein